MEKKKFKFSKKNILITVTIVLITLVAISGVCYFYYGIGMSTDKKILKIRDIISKGNYNEAQEVNNRFFRDTDQATKAYHDFNKSMINLCEDTKSRSFQEALNK